MNKIANISAIALYCCVIGCNTPQRPVSITNHVIVIGVDGMSPDGINRAATPNLDYLMQNGASTLHARAVLPTSSSSNWASMLMGASPAQHGITSNGWERDDFTLPPVTTGIEDIFPTIFGVIRQQKPDAETGAIYHWQGFGRLFEKSAVNFDIACDNEFKTTEQASQYIIQKKPNFTFIHLDHVDHAGHTSGHGTPAYLDAVTVADSLVGRIIEAAKTSGIFDDCIFIVSADHGGIGYGHGGETLEEIEIPFIVFGKGIKNGYTIDQPVYTYDNAATVATCFGFRPPQAWIGRPVTEAFAGFANSHGGQRAGLLSPPTILPDRKFYDPPGGLFVDQEPVVVIKTDVEDVVVRYTLDGSEPDSNSMRYEMPFKLHESAVLKAKSFRGKEKSKTQIGFYRLVRDDGKHGLRFKYYEGGDWTQIPDFDTLEPVKSGTALEFRLNQIEHRENQFAVCFEGYLEIKKSGLYKFYSNSDDGSKVFIEGKNVVDNDGNHGVLERSGQIQLATGLASIRVDYLNAGGGSWLDVYYRGPGITKQIIPASLLYRQ